MTKSVKRTLICIYFAAATIMMLPVVFRSAHAAQAKVKLNKTSLELLAGSSEQLKISGTSKTVTWKSKKKSIATVDADGVVTGVKSGSCKIIAKVGKKKYTCKVTVRSLKNVNTTGALRGIDVSIYQGKINFKKVKADGISFVIMRAGHGSVVDSTFNTNYKKAKKNGLMVGCYWFITAASESELKKQAKKCLKTIKGKKFEFPVFVDIESYSQFNKGKTFCSNLVSTFCDMVKKKGYTPGWYTSRSFISPYLSDKVARESGYVTWIAEHSGTLNYEYPCDIWQFSHTGRVNGINTYVDLNWCFPNAFDDSLLPQPETEAATEAQTQAQTEVQSETQAETSAGTQTAS